VQIIGVFESTEEISGRRRPGNRSRWWYRDYIQNRVSSHWIYADNLSSIHKRIVDYFLKVISN